MDIFVKEGFILVQFLVLPRMFTLEFVLGKMDSLTFGEWGSKGVIMRKKR